MYKKCVNCYKDGKVPNEESCKKCEDDFKAKEQKCETLASQLDFEVQKKECLEQECERLKQLNCIYSIGVKQADELQKTLDHKQAYINNIENYNEQLNKQLDQLKAKNNDLKKQLMQKSDIDMFFSTPIEGWSNDSCGICKYKNCLTEIKEIASKVLLNTHDLEQFEDADALFGALLEIHKKISEVEDV